MVENERSEAYKHLEEKLRLGGLTIGQWVAVSVTVTIAVLFGLYVSPLPPGPTLMVSLLLAGSPVVLGYAVTGRDLEVCRTLLAVVRWARGAKHYLPGGGPPPEAGYVVLVPSAPPRLAPRPAEDADVMRDQLEEAWSG